MRFKFCSEGDCPAWALAALHALAALPPATTRDLVDYVTEDACAGAADEDRIMEILKDTNLNGRAGGAGAAAAVRWACRSAWRAGCGGAALARDLHVLGAPRHLATALAAAADAQRAAYERRASAAPFLVNRVTDAAVKAGPEGSVNTIQLTLRTDDVFSGHREEHSLLLDNHDANTLLAELKKVYTKMEEIEMD